MLVCSSFLPEEVARRAYACSTYPLDNVPLSTHCANCTSYKGFEKIYAEEAMEHSNLTTVRQTTSVGIEKSSERRRSSGCTADHPQTKTSRLGCVTPLKSRLYRFKGIVPHTTIISHGLADGANNDIIMHGAEAPN